MNDTLGLIAVFLSLVIFLGTLGPAVSAETREGYVYLEPGQFQAWEFSSVIPSRVSADIQVTSGGSIDVLFLTIGAYQSYEAGSEFDFDPISSLNVTTFILTDLLVNPGTFYLVVDNTNRSMSADSAIATTGANVSFQVSMLMEADLEQNGVGISTWIYVFLIGAVVMLIVILYVTRDALKRLKKR